MTRWTSALRLEATEGGRPWYSVAFDPIEFGAPVADDAFQLDLPADALVHTWDLATATGQDVAWDHATLACSWEAIRSQLPEADRDPQWEAVRAMMPPGVPFDGPFANAVDVADDAPLIDRLVAWNGRTP